MLREDDESGEPGGDLPDEAGVLGEPLDVPLVAAVEEDGPAGGPPAGGAHQVPLFEAREGGVEAEVVEALPEVAGLVNRSGPGSWPVRLGGEGGEGVGCSGEGWGGEWEVAEEEEEEE